MLRLLRIFTLMVLIVSTPEAHAQDTLDVELVSRSLQDAFLGDCKGRAVRTRGAATISDLGKCGVSVQTTNALGTNQAGTLWGVSRTRLNGGAWLPVGGLAFGSDGARGPARAAETTLQSFGGGSVEANAFVSSVVSAVPTDDPDFGPSNVTLHIRGSGFEHFSTASAKVYDHDTNELLLSWDKSDLPLEPNTISPWNGTPTFFSQQINFDDRLGHSIRFEYEAMGQAGSLDDARFQAAVFMWVPEPSSSLMAMLAILPIAELRKRGRRCT